MAAGRRARRSRRRVGPAPPTFSAQHAEVYDDRQRRGLPELWLVDTAALAVLVVRRSRPDAAEFDAELRLEVADELPSPALPGFELAVADVFRVT